MLRFGVAVVVKQRKAQVEAAQHLNKPLMLQGFRHHDKYALGTASQQLLLDDHPGFNGFTQANFIGQQHARRMAAAHIMGDVQLVRDQVSTHTA